MPTLNPKPNPFRQGATKLSAEALDQMRRGQERQIVGGEDTNVSYYGDRVLIQNRKSTQLPDVTNYLAQFKVLQEYDDYLLCSVYHQPTDLEQHLIPEQYDKNPVQDANLVVCVAKPFNLQRTPWDGRQFTTSYSNVSKFTYYDDKLGLRTIESVSQTAEPSVTQGGLQRITPAYMPGDILLACPAITGLDDGQDVPIKWTDVNAAGRSWSDDGGGTKLITDNYTVTLEDHLFLLNVDATDQDIDIQLPSTGIPVGFRFWVRRIDTKGANNGKLSDPENYPYHLVQLKGSTLETGVVVGDPFTSLGGIYFNHITNSGFRLEVQYEVWLIEWTATQWAVISTNQRPNVVFGYDGDQPNAVFSSLGNPATIGGPVENYYLKKAANCCQIQFSYLNGMYVHFNDQPNYSKVAIGGMEAQATYNSLLPLLKPMQRGIMTENEQSFWGVKDFYDGAVIFDRLTFHTTVADTTSPTITGKIFVNPGTGPSGDGVLSFSVNSPFSDGTAMALSGHDSSLNLIVQKSDTVNPGVKPTTPRPSIKYKSLTDTAAGDYFNFFGLTVCGGAVMGLETFGDVYNEGRVILGAGGTLDDGTQDTNILPLTSLLPGSTGAFLQCNGLGHAVWSGPGGSVSGSDTDSRLNDLIAILQGLGLIS